MNLELTYNLNNADPKSGHMLYTGEFSFENIVGTYQVSFWLTIENPVIYFKLSEWIVHTGNKVFESSEVGTYDTSYNISSKNRGWLQLFFKLKSEEPITARAVDKFIKRYIKEEIISRHIHWFQTKEENAILTNNIFKEIYKENKEK